MRMHVFTALCIALVVGCDMENGDCDVNPEMRQEENVDLNRDGVADLNGRGREAITITDVVLHESEGGYCTDNRFICNVRSREDCELWLEVCDYSDGHRFSEIKDESWTRRIVSASPYGSNSTYKVNIVVDGDGEMVKSFVTLWGRTLPCGDAIILFKTNAVLGTWKGR